MIMQCLYIQCIIYDFTFTLLSILNFYTNYSIRLSLCKALRLFPCSLEVSALVKYYSAMYCLISLLLRFALMPFMFLDTFFYQFLQTENVVKLFSLKEAAELLLIQFVWLDQ